MDKIRVAIVGVGNCAKSLVEGVYFYQNCPANGFIPGLMHNSMGGYKISDIEFSAAFDIDTNKVGKDLSEAIKTHPNCAMNIVNNVPHLNISVMRSKTLDSLGPCLKKVINESSQKEVDVTSVLKETKTDIVINYLPTGSMEASFWYANQSLEAGCGFVNCIPTPIAAAAVWQTRFKEKNIPRWGCGRCYPLHEIVYGSKFRWSFGRSKQLFYEASSDSIL